MKVDKKNPRHWLLLIISALLVFVSMPFRVFRNRNRKSIVFFYQMHGNSKAFVEFLQKNHPDINLYFLAFPEYLKIYEHEHNLPSLSMLKFTDMIKVAQCDAIITNYQPLTLIYYAKFAGMKFFDVGHGLPLLKKFTPQKLKYLNDYAETWVASPAMVDEFHNLYKITTPVVATGYARVDKLVTNGYENVRKKYELPDKKIVMIAPTWQQYDPNRKVMPFNSDELPFFQHMDRLGKKTDSLIVIRVHMLSNVTADVSGMDNVRLMSVQDYPDTEELLSVVDVLVTDWSSIAYDFLPLDRPVIFIDVPAPFVGEELAQRANTEFRFGKLVANPNELDASISRYLKDPAVFKKEFAGPIKKATEVSYGTTLDGKASERYYKRLKKNLA